MADVITGVDDCSVLLGQAHIEQTLGRLDANTQAGLGRLDANTQATLGRNEANVRYDIGSSTSNIRHDIGDASANIRRENAQSEAEVRRDVLGTSADIRRETAYETGTIRRETATEACKVVDAVKTAGWANSDRTGTEADRIVAQDTAYFIANQQQNFSNATALAALKAATDAQFAETLASIRLSEANATAEARLAGFRAEAATNMSRECIEKNIIRDGDVTRALINELKVQDLNRMLIERNAEIVECRGDSRYWHGQFNNSQQANLVSQVNALNSQFAETRQGMVNFGTMAGVGQSSTSNNVR